MTFDELDRARRLFGLHERATLREIKNRHRALAKRFHPDQGENGDAEQMRQVNAAYRLLIDYCAGYRFGYTVCGHRDPKFPLLTLSRRVLWERACVDARGGFSGAVLADLRKVLKGWETVLSE